MTHEIKIGMLKYIKIKKKLWYAKAKTSHKLKENVSKKTFNKELISKICKEVIKVND